MTAPSVGVDVELRNVGSVLRALKQIDPDLRRRVPDEIKSPAQPMLVEIRAKMPATLMSGFTTGSKRYRPGRARQRTTLRFRGTRPRSAPGDSWPLLRVVTTDPALSITGNARRAQAGIDRAGRPYGTRRGSAMIAQLPGGPERWLWPTVERWAPRLEDDIQDIIDGYARIVSRKLEA